jgi:hypothetical protein
VVGSVNFRESDPHAAWFILFIRAGRIRPNDLSYGLYPWREEGYTDRHFKNFIGLERLTATDESSSETDIFGLTRHESSRAFDNDGP